jgi:hypothetical protein
MENVSTVNAFVNLAGLMKIAPNKFVLIIVITKEFAKTGNVYVNQDGKVLIVA